MEILHEEHQYLELIKRILRDGIQCNDRTGTGTRSVFGAQLRFSLRNNQFPLLTTKRVAIKSIIGELLFFIRGQTNNKILKQQGIHIWDGNSTREFFDKVGIQREEDDLGPVYGFQWRHFGAHYKTCHDDYTGEGVDQLKYVIDEIQKNPESRRIIVSAWNPLCLKDMALPPCHTLFQFRVYGNKLSCMLYQRSGDVGLGIPFNIASYALLTIIVAQICNLEPDEFVHTIGDAHIYNDHIEALNKQITRTPFPFPKLKLANKEYRKFEDFEIEDFILEDYNHHPGIIMKMSV
ncbi:thymidylate synthase [Enterocytozoon bieneusi H348]|nr:thymidylate synthase [Enterocytozoon bieneusi H348]|eukprot:XP_002650147.1 thymidylate synthase [Enterocytozoon bieneusi H348]